MAQYSSEMEGAMVEVAAEVMVVLMAVMVLNQIARMVISIFFLWRKQKLNFEEFFFQSCEKETIDSEIWAEILIYVNLFSVLMSTSAPF